VDRTSGIALVAGSSRRMGVDELSLPRGEGAKLDVALRTFFGLTGINGVVVTDAEALEGHRSRAVRGGSQ